MAPRVSKQNNFQWGHQSLDSCFWQCLVLMFPVLISIKKNFSNAFPETGIERGQMGIDWILTMSEARSTVTVNHHNILWVKHFDFQYCKLQLTISIVDVNFRVVGFGEVKVIGINPFGFNLCIVNTMRFCISAPRSLDYLLTCHNVPHSLPDKALQPV